MTILSVKGQLLIVSRIQNPDYETGIMCQYVGDCSSGVDLREDGDRSPLIRSGEDTVIYAPTVSVCSVYSCIRYCDVL